MKLNCRPGDLAVCIKPTIFPAPISPLGKTCIVLRVAPGGKFKLPDGMNQVASIHKKNEWVVEWSQEIAYPMLGGGWRHTKYGVIPDRALRPIRDPGDDAVDETLRNLEIAA